MTPADSFHSCQTGTLCPLDTLTTASANLETVLNVSSEGVHVDLLEQDAP